jgi:hypothetical protein
MTMSSSFSSSSALTSAHTTSSFLALSSASSFSFYFSLYPVSAIGKLTESNDNKE